MIQTTRTSSATRTMSQLESILDMNNHAVNYLCQGNHSATTSTLREAIKGLEKCFREAKEAVAASGSSSSCEPPRKRRRQDLKATTDVTQTTKDLVPVRIITVSHKTTSPSSSTEAVEEDPTAILNFYDRAFDFPSIEEEEDKDCTSQQSKTRLAAILLYNLGLAYHREGVRSGTSKDLSAALKFYREAYMVLKSAWADTDFQEVFVLLLALLNNMACIHVTNIDAREARQCIDWMKRAMTSRQRYMLTKEDYAAFSMNVSLFRGNQLRFAAAA